MISIDPGEMKSAGRLNGTTINGYAGYYGETICGTTNFFVIAIPLNAESVANLMREIDSKN